VTDLPFVDEVLEHRPGERLVARCDWDTARDPCLLDHTIERAAVSRRDGSRVGLPVVPLTLSLELLAEVGCAFAGGGVVTALTDVVAHRWTSLPEGRRAVLATAEPGRAAGAVAVSVEDAGEPSAPLLSATVHVAAGYPPAPDPVPGPTGPRPDPGVAFYGADGLFHGPRFQVVRSLDSVSADAATATLTSRGPREVLGDRRGSLATDPALLDGPGQVLARWLATQQRDGLDIFPVRLDALRLFAPPPPAGARFGCRLKVTETEPARLRTDLELVDDGGRLTARFSGWEDVRVTLPERFRDFLGRPAEAFLSDRWTPAGDALREGAGRRLPGLAPEVLGYGGLWLGVLAHCVLAPEERSDWHRLAAAPTRRRAQWLCGRIAAKEALRDLLAAAGEPDWADADIMIATGPGGRPVVAGSWPLAGSAPSISIAHTDGMVVAVARPAATGAVGVDVQAVGTVPAAAEHLAFDDWERTWLTGVDPGDRALRATELWCAKEAAAKAVGSGVPLPPSALGVRVELQDRGLLAKVAVAGLATGGVGGPDGREPALVTVVEDGGFVYALCSWGDQAPVGSTPAMGGRS
jgi:phosphopantetheinyl transferase